MSSAHQRSAQLYRMKRSVTPGAARGFESKISDQVAVPRLVRGKRKTERIYGGEAAGCRTGLISLFYVSSILTPATKISGSSRVVRHLLWEQRIGCSIHPAPTKFMGRSRRPCRTSN